MPILMADIIYPICLIITSFQQMVTVVCTQAVNLQPFIMLKSQEAI